MNRSPELLVLLGSVALGLAIGLAYAWLIDPVELYNTTPHVLRVDYRHDWIRLAALGYVTDGDIQRAETRLADFEPEDLQSALAALLESYAAQGQTADVMRPLSNLADRLGVDTPAMAVYLGPPPEATSPPPPSPTPWPSPTVEPITPTPTPTPMLSPLPIPSPSSWVISQTWICTGTTSQLQVWVQAIPAVEEPEDEEEQESEPPAAEPLAGVVLWLTWPDGADRAVTGLRPTIDPGYADFSLQQGVPYALSIDEPNAPILSGLATQACPAGEDGTISPGVWQIVVGVRSP